MSYEILTNTPAPEIKRGAPTSYPFGNMAVGNVFMVEPGDKGVEKALARLKGAAQRWKKATGNKDIKFLVAEYTDPMGSGVKVGVWRTA